MDSDLGLRDEILAGREEKKAQSGFEEPAMIYYRFWSPVPGLGI